MIAIAAVLLGACKAAAAEWPYKAGEVNVDLFAQVRTTDFDNEAGAAGAGLTLFVSENVGVRVEGLSYNTDRRFVDEVNGSLVYRVPSGRAAPYFFGGGGYRFEVDDYTVHAGIGVEHRFGDSVGAFVDARFEKRLDSGESAGIGRAGVRFAF